MAQENPDTPPRKNPLSPGGDPKKKKNFLNIYWIYGIVFLGIIGYNLYRNVNVAGIETDQQKFFEMVAQGDIDKAEVVRNKNIVRVYVKPASLQSKKDQYSAWLNTPLDPNATRQFIYLSRSWLLV